MAVLHGGRRGPPLCGPVWPGDQHDHDFMFIDEKRYRFVSEDRFLIGTNILNNYNMNVIFINEPSDASIKTAYLELIPHNYRVPQSRSQEYTLKQLAQSISHVQEYIDDGMTETITDD